MWLRLITNLGQGGILHWCGREAAALGSSRPLRELHRTGTHRRPNPHEQFSQEPTGAATAAPAATPTSATITAATVSAATTSASPPTHCDSDERRPRRPADQL